MTKKLILTLTLSIFGLSIGCYTVYTISKANKREAELTDLIEQEKQRGTELDTKLNRTLSQNDSLFKMNEHLYSQKQLTEAMVFRDNAMSMTSKIRPGNLIKLLDTGDSAIVTEFLTGGNQYNHWIKYKVVGKFGEREVSPLLICVHD